MGAEKDVQFKFHAVSHDMNPVCIYFTYGYVSSICRSVWKDPSTSNSDTTKRTLLRWCPVLTFRIIIIIIIVVVIVIVIVVIVVVVVVFVVIVVVFVVVVVIIVIVIV